MSGSLGPKNSPADVLPLWAGKRSMSMKFVVKPLFGPGKTAHGISWVEHPELGTPASAAVQAKVWNELSNSKFMRLYPTDEVT